MFLFLEIELKLRRLLDWKEFTSKSVERFSFQCLTGNICQKEDSSARRLEGKLASCCLLMKG